MVSTTSFDYSVVYISPLEIFRLYGTSNSPTTWELNSVKINIFHFM